MAVLVQELVDEVRVMSGLRNNQYYTDAQIAQFLDDAAKELYDRFILSQQHYFIKNFAFTLTGNTKDTAKVKLPDDFMKENLVVKNPGNQEIQIDMIDNYQQTTANFLETIAGVSGPRWFISGDYLVMYPYASSAGNYELRYTPMTETLSLGYKPDLAITPNYTVRAATATTLDSLPGDWSAPTGNSLLLLANQDFRIEIDSVPLVPGDKVLFFPEDAPIDPVNQGIWSYSGVDDSGGQLTFSFTRPIGKEVGDSLTYDKVVYVTEGSELALTYWHVSQDNLIGTDSNHYNPCNGLAVSIYGPLLTLWNAEVGTSWTGGKVTIDGARKPTNNGNFDIQGYLPVGDFLVLVGADIVAEALPSSSSVVLEKPGYRTTVPQVLTPWALFLKIHASIAVRTGRQQGTQELQVKLQQQEQRIAAISVNRTERVQAAPITRGRRGNFWGGSGNNGF